MHERFFTMRLTMASYEELNAWLLDRYIAYTKAHKHPELIDQPICQVFEAERAHPVPVANRFNGFHATIPPISKICLVRLDNNKHSVTPRSKGTDDDHDAGALKLHHTSVADCARYDTLLRRI